MEAMLPMLKQQLTASSPDINLMERLGEIYRHLGRLNDAKTTYRQLRQLDESDQYIALANNQLSRFTSQHLLSNLFWPTPFCHQESVLSQPEYTRILNWCHSKGSEFKPAEVELNRTKQVDLTFRNQSTYECNSQEVSWINNTFRPLIKKSIKELGLGNRKRNIIGVDLSLTQNGGFGKPHADGLTNETQSPIQVFSFLYYLSTTPSKFNGGDLVLHDTNFKSNSFKPISTKIPFSANSIVFFPRYFFHSINPVCEVSPMSWADGRFAIFINVLVEDSAISVKDSSIPVKDSTIPVKDS